MQFVGSHHLIGSLPEAALTQENPLDRHNNPKALRSSQPGMVAEFQLSTPTSFIGGSRRQYLTDKTGAHQELAVKEDAAIDFAELTEAQSQVLLANLGLLTLALCFLLFGISV